MSTIHTSSAPASPSLESMASSLPASPFSFAEVPPAPAGEDNNAEVKVPGVKKHARFYLPADNAILLVRSIISILPRYSLTISLLSDRSKTPSTVYLVTSCSAIQLTSSIPTVVGKQALTMILLYSRTSNARISMNSLVYCIPGRHRLIQLRTSYE